MKKSLNALTVGRLALGAIGLSILLVSISSFSEKRNTRKSKELDEFIKVYRFIPFNIPRDGDGVGTIVTFKRKREAVIAAPNECFDLTSLTVDTLRGDLPDYEYMLSKENELEFNTGKIFGDKTKLIGAFKDKRVNSVKVKFSDVFEVRTTRISVERQMLEMDELCTKKALQRKNYLIERVLGVGAIEVIFYNENGQEVSLDLDLMDEINIGNEFKRQFNGQNSLSFSEPRLIGYRLWDIEVEIGFAESTYSLDTLDLEKTLNLKIN